MKPHLFHAGPRAASHRAHWPTASELQAPSTQCHLGRALDWRMLGVRVQLHAGLACPLTPGVTVALRYCGGIRGLQRFVNWLWYERFLSSRSVEYRGYGGDGGRTVEKRNSSSRSRMKCGTKWRGEDTLYVLQPARERRERTGAGVAALGLGSFHGAVSLSSSPVASLPHPLPSPSIPSFPPLPFLLPFLPSFFPSARPGCPLLTFSPLVA